MRWPVIFRSMVVSRSACARHHTARVGRCVSISKNGPRGLQVIDFSAPVAIKPVSPCPAPIRSFVMFLKNVTIAVGTASRRRRAVAPQLPPGQPTRMVVGFGTRITKNAAACGEIANGRLRVAVYSQSRRLAASAAAVRLTPLPVYIVPLAGDGGGGDADLVALLLPSPSQPPCDEALVAALSLTKAEARVVHHVMMGRKVRRIAEKMSLTEQTVRTYLKRIYAKLEVSGQCELIAKVSGFSIPFAASRLPSSKSAVSKCSTSMLGHSD